MGLLLRQTERIYQMSILPPNKPQKARKVPRNFFIFGDTMSGKSYLAERFPDPLFINTDGNSEMNTAPSIQIRNERDAQGKLTKSVIDALDEIILALKNENHGFKTVVIDVIDDLVTMLEQAICYENDVRALSDIPYGKGYSSFNSALQEFVIELKALPLNVVYISRIMQVGEGATTKEVPSLKTKYYNVVNGNCDLVIETKRVGRNYIRRVTDRRIHYLRTDIDDQSILRVLDNVTGVFDRPTTTTRQKQQEIVKNIEQQEKGED